MLQINNVIYKKKFLEDIFKVFNQISDSDEFNLEVMVRTFEDIKIKE